MCNRFVFLFAFCLAPLVAAESAVALRLGVGRADITPGTDVRNWVTGKAYGAVLDPLAVQVLTLDDGVTKAAVVRWDLTDVSESARDEVRRVIETATGIPGGNILVNASHTHSAPWSPVYRDGYRGRERDNWWALRYMPAQNDHPPFRAWMQRLLDASVEATKAALAAARPASMSIGRVSVAEYLYNRRPRAPAWGLAEPKAVRTMAASSPDWNAAVLTGGSTFGPMDRTLSLLWLRAEDGKNLATLYHTSVHSVSIYPSNPGISADWPGPASAAIAGAFGGEALFLQGTCGDITPWRRGPQAVAEMAEAFVKKAREAEKFAVRLAPRAIRTARATIDLPLTPAARARTGTESVAAEVQVIVCGPLAFVALPGEPLTDLGTAIREQSPFPQTLVLGYSNGMGVHYVGMPGEKARGGYEAGVAGAGTDECGRLLVEAAVRLLRETYSTPGYPGKS
jgi:neutral ceramidase